MGVLKTGGDFICKIGNNINEIKELLYICSLCFEKVSMFKPISDNFDKNTSYFICQNYHNNNQCLDWHNNLNSEKINEDIIPVDFIIFLNNYIDSYNQLINNISNEKFEIYNIYKCKSIWNIF